MFETIKRFREMPGNFETVNVFDLLYSGITAGLIYTLGGGSRALGRVGINVNKVWAPGEKLKILFLAYSGARNTGAEVRVGECIRQVNQVLGEDRVEINMTTLDLREATEYFKGYKVNLIEFSSIFFKDVFQLVLENHMVVLVEGSCWKENFATALLLYFLYGAGLAKQLGKPSFSYAVDAGEMNRINNFMSYLFSRDTKLITRSEDSIRVLESIGLRGAVNRVDTAWSMPTESPLWAKNQLKKKGWDGKRPLLGLAFQNYFWWPVIPDLARWIKCIATGDKKNQYKLVYFYDYDERDEQEFTAFMKSLARVMDRAVDQYEIQPVIFAMEALDDDACREIIKVMNHDAILVSCKEYVGSQIGALLRRLGILVTTRYHAMALSMPAQVPFIGLSRDERILGVMKEIGLYDDYYLDYRTPDLEGELRKRIDGLLENEDEQIRVREGIRDNLPYYYAQMGMLGIDIRNLVRERFPGFPLIELDENRLTSLVPYIPSNFRTRAQRRFQGLKLEDTKNRH